MNPITSFIVAVLGLAGIAVGVSLGPFTGPLVSGLIVILAALIAVLLKMANTWQKFVILRAGKMQGVKGPGLFFIILVIDTSSRLSTSASSTRRSTPIRRLPKTPRRLAANLQMPADAPRRKIE